MSHPMWVRGLKPLVLLMKLAVMSSHPMWVRGLKRSVFCDADCVIRSHPMWVRGLKLACGVVKTRQKLSHPMWVRGLKRHQTFFLAARSCVAPYVGAWIETVLALRQAEALQSRTLCGCVD